MWKVDAKLFYWTSAALARLHAVLKMGSDQLSMDRKALVSERSSQEVLPSLRSLADELDIINARLTSASVRRLEHALISKKCTHGDMIDLIGDIDRRLRDELELVHLYCLDENKISILLPHPSCMISRSSTNFRWRFQI